MDTGLTLIASNGYISAIEFDSENDYGFFASAAAGDSSTYFCDRYYQDSGNRVAHFGGGWNYAAYAGAFNLYLSNSAATSYLSIGARITFVPKK